jgi:Rrf2 family cysteine metabolism transcriptional repressor
MNISTRGRYGLRAILVIAKDCKEGPVTIRDISRKQKMSVTYLEQILHRLKKAGLIESVRGAKGGYLLARKENKITVREIIDVLDGPLSFSYCDFPELREKSCTGPETCVSRILWKRMEDNLSKMLSNVTLADLKKEANALKNNRRKR